MPPYSGYAARCAEGLWPSESLLQQFGAMPLQRGRSPKFMRRISRQV